MIEKPSYEELEARIKILEKNRPDHLHNLFEHLRALMESATGFAIYRLVNDGENPHQLQVKLVSPSIKDILGIPEPLLFETWFQNMHPDDVDRIDEANRKALTTMRFDEEYRTFHQGKGEWRWIHAISTGGIDENGWNKYVNGILFDVTDYKNIEKKLKEKTIALKRINENIVNIEHKQRKIFASDLHDTVGQTLALSISILNNIIETAEERDRARLIEVNDYLEHSIKDIRGLIHRLSPPVLTDFGIGVALDNLVKIYNSKFDMNIVYINSFIGPTHFEEIDRSIIYRIVDELIVNIRKHSKSTSSEIELSKHKGQLCIRVEDYGIGFDTRKLNNNDADSFGIRSVIERIDGLNGQFDIVSNPGKGTKIKIHIPIFDRRKE